MSVNETYTAKLRDHGLSNTRARRIVFDVLSKRGHHPLTMKELIAAVGSKIDRASVYRTIEALEKADVVHRLQVGWKYKLELSDDFHGHHHHITCTHCGATHATHDDDQFESMLSSLAAKHGYIMSDHQLTIKGICSDCYKKNPA